MENMINGTNQGMMIDSQIQVLYFLEYITTAKNFMSL
jgi:hypothetical protein